MITSIDSQQIDFANILLSFTSDATPPVTFRVIVDGVERTVPNTNGSGSIRINVGTGSIFVEVLDDDSRRHPACPSQILLNWRRIAGSTAYRLEEFNDPSWTAVATLPETGAGNSLYLTRAVVDGEDVQFRVVPIDVSGTEGDPITFNHSQVRHPEIPAVTYTWSGGVVTIS